MVTPTADPLRTAREVARFAGLSIDEERLAELAPRLVRFRAFLDTARAVPLGDCEPTHIAPLLEWDDDER